MKFSANFWIIKFESNLLLQLLKDEAVSFYGDSTTDDAVDMTEVLTFAYRNKTAEVTLGLLARRAGTGTAAASLTE